MCCCLHLRSTRSHVSTFGELHMGHVFDRYASLPKKSCFRACPIYCLVRNFTRHVFCLSVMVGLFQNSFDKILSISWLLSHLFSEVSNGVFIWCMFLALSATNFFVGSTV
jgi:hypothetical protein